jgi:hypothetical protein
MARAARRDEGNGVFSGALPTLNNFNDLLSRHTNEYGFCLYGLKFTSIYD